MTIRARRSAAVLAKGGVASVLSSAFACLLVSGLVAASLSGCAPTGGADGKIALLLPESKTARYESFDRPFFEKRISALGDFEVLYSNADQDASKQQSQAEAALASGADVLVLDAVDSAAAVSIVAAANAQDVPVIAYDRFISGGELDYYISFDNEQIGVLQGEALVAQLNRTDAGGGILMVDGSPTDSNAADFKKGAHSVIDDSGYDVLAEFDTPDWSPDKAQDWVAGQITQYSGRIAAVYAANDGIAGGAIAAVRAANLSPAPVITGQDAELAGIQRIIAGDQYMTIYKDIRAEAELAAEIAVRLARGETVRGDIDVDGVPSTRLTAEVVTLDTILTTVVADGIYDVSEICTAQYADACDAAGISSESSR